MRELDFDVCDFMSSADPDLKVLSFGDVVLRQSDVWLLQGPHWLNDQIIAFFFEYMAQNKFKLISGITVFLPGAISFLLANCGPSEAGLILEPLEVNSKSLVLFAVNDNTDLEAAGGGSHWSLLVYFGGVDTFRHYDSSPGRGSRSAATRLHRAVQNVLVPTGQECPLVHVSDMPHQENGYDCGVYVMAMADAICARTQRMLQGSREAGSSGHGRNGFWSHSDIESWERGLSSWLTSQLVAEFRAQVLDLVSDFEKYRNIRRSSRTRSSSRGLL